MMEDSSDSLD